MKKFLLILIITLGIIPITYAWNGLIAQNGDILSTVKWNQLISIINLKLNQADVIAGDGIIISSSGSQVDISLAPIDPVDPSFYKAAGSVTSAGALEEGAGASVSRVTTGTYDISFNSPASSTTYPVLATMQGLPQNDDYQWAYLNRTVNGFRIEVREQDNGTTAGVLRDSGFSFFVPLF